MNTTDATPAADRGSECNDLLGQGSEAVPLVERLRTRNGRADGFGLGPVCDEAADEIERLTELEAALEALVNRCNADFLLAADGAVIAAEAALERLYRARMA